MSKINYFFENTSVSKHFLPPKRWIITCLKKEGKKIGCLNFIFCSDTYLKSLNQKYLKKSYLTDVISFPYEGPGLFQKKEAAYVYGDIFISIERVKENQKTYNTIFAKELKRVMAHGALHLIGFNDKTKKERAIMAAKENIYLEAK